MGKTEGAGKMVQFNAEVSTRSDPAKRSQPYTSLERRLDEEMRRVEELEAIVQIQMEWRNRQQNSCNEDELDWRLAAAEDYARRLDSEPKLATVNSDGTVSVVSVESERGIETPRSGKRR